MKYLLSFFLFVNCYCLFGQNCSQLPDGKYDAESNQQIRNPKTSFEIIGNYFCTYIDGKRKQQEIIRLSECSFQLKNNEIVDETKLTELQKVLKNQKPYYEITKVEGNVYHFVCRVDLHIISYTGRFIKR